MDAVDVGLTDWQRLRTVGRRQSSFGGAVAAAMACAELFNASDGSAAPVYERVRQVWNGGSGEGVGGSARMSYGSRRGEVGEDEGR